MANAARVVSPAPIGLFCALLAATGVGCSDESSSHAAPGSDAGPDAGAVAPKPIIVTSIWHFDPLPPGDVAEPGYQATRESVLWLLDVAAETGHRISAQVTGNYAEAAVTQGHSADFADFMPGGRHHLGTHIHDYTYGGAPFAWNQLAEVERTDPTAVLQVFNDNVGWLNQLFAANGADAEDNWYLHGSFVFYPGMQGPILRKDGTAATTYPNSYRACQLGSHYLSGPYRGSCYDSVADGGSADPAGDFVVIPEVGGIIGYDVEHIPEGMQYGTVPYLRRDFLRQLLEWREAARLDPDSGPFHFAYRSHPWVLTPQGELGSDGRPVRDSLVEFLGWLDEHYVGRTDEAGRTVATNGTVEQIVEEYLAWETRHPDDLESRAAAINSASQGRRLPGLWNQLDLAYHDEELAIAGVTAHRFLARDGGASWVLLYSDRGNTEVPAGGDIPADRDVMTGDGAISTQSGSVMSIGEAPVLITTTGGFAQAGGNG